MGGVDFTWDASNFSIRVSSLVEFQEKEKNIAGVFGLI